MDSISEISETLLKIVELKTGVVRKDIFTDRRKRPLVIARCLYVNLLHLFTNLSEGEIGKKIKKDRTTVYYMYRVHSDLISVDKAYLKMFEDCSNKYVDMVSTAKYMLVDPAIIMRRLRNAEFEILELKEIMTKRLSIKPNDELVTD